MFGFVVAVALIGGATVWVLERRPPSASNADPRNASVSVPGVAAVGAPAPTFMRPALVGNGAVALAPGRPTVLTFWASWCAPCRKEFPLLRAAASADPDLAVIGVVYRDIPADARAFVAEQDATWGNALDENGDVAVAYGVRAIPQTFFIDRTGVIRARVFGVSSRTALEAELAKIR